MSNKKGFFSGLILKDEDNIKPEANPKDKPSDLNKSPKPSVQTNSSITVQGVPDNKFVEMLEGVLEQNSTKDQDYFKFKQAIENMKSLSLDEKTKFQTVFTVLSLQGCKKDLLLSSVDKYVSLIQTEKNNFDGEMKNQFAEKVQSRFDKVENAKKELDTLTKKLGELNTLILTLSQEAQGEELKIKATEANFKASADLIVNEINSDKEKITNYIAV